MLAECQTKFAVQWPFAAKVKALPAPPRAQKRYPEHMSGIFRLKSHTVILCFLLLLYSGINVRSESFRYSPVSRQVVESRLGKYAGDNKQRELTLKQMFAEAGCDEQHLSEQPVKGSKQPNVICLLPGTSDKVIIVGAHFDYVSAGNGVVDNWSGASLLPSLYRSDQNRAAEA